MEVTDKLIEEIKGYCIAPGDGFPLLNQCTTEIYEALVELQHLRNEFGEREKMFYSRI